MKNALELSHITKDYGSFRLDDISFSLPGGAILGLIGENGAGKTTTIKCILNLIHRDAGEIRVLGQDNLAQERAIKEDLGVVLDESVFHDSLRPRDVDRIMARLYKGWDSALFARYCGKFSLPNEKTIKEFSKGMKMKLSIAAALAHRPRLLILDEATSGLDPVAREEILDEFLDFIQDEEHSVLLSSHITSDLEKCADYIVYLHRGELAAVRGEGRAPGVPYGRLACTAAHLEPVTGPSRTAPGAPNSRARRW